VADAAFSITNHDDRGAQREVKILNWCALCGGSSASRTPLLILARLHRDVTMGGLSGHCTLGPRMDLQQTDTLLRGGPLPLRTLRRSDLRPLPGAYLLVAQKMHRQKCLDERIGKVELAADAARLHRDLLPSALPRLIGCPSPSYTYAGDLGLELWNLSSPPSGRSRSALSFLC